MTKIGGDRSYDDAMRIIDRSLKNLGVSHVDLMHIHGLGNESDLAAIEAPNGQLKAMQRAKEQKMTRFIGVTSHQNPQVLRAAADASRVRFHADGAQHRPDWRRCAVGKARRGHDGCLRL